MSKWIFVVCCLFFLSVIVANAAVCEKKSEMSLYCSNQLFVICNGKEYKDSQTLTDEQFNAIKDYFDDGIILSANKLNAFCNEVRNE